MMPNRGYEPPTRRPDGSWKVPIQVVIQRTGRWETGAAEWLTVGYGADWRLATLLQRCLR